MSSTIPPLSSSFDNPLDDQRNLFAPENVDEDPNYAKAICGRCPVAGSCLSYALRTMPDGIWGGTTSEERSAIRVRSAVRFPAPAEG
jgi:hypothetical protein